MLGSFSIVHIFPQDQIPCLQRWTQARAISAIQSTQEPMWTWCNVWLNYQAWLQPTHSLQQTIWSSHTESRTLLCCWVSCISVFLELPIPLPCTYCYRSRMVLPAVMSKTPKSEKNNNEKKAIVQQLSITRAPFFFLFFLNILPICYVSTYTLITCGGSSYYLQN